MSVENKLYTTARDENGNLIATLSRDVKSNSNSLKSIFFQLTQNNITRLVFSNFESNVAKQLISLVKSMQISFDIVLPEPYGMTNEQRELDAMVSNNRRKISIESFQKSGATVTTGRKAPSTESPTPVSISRPNLFDHKLAIEQTYTEEMQVQCDTMLEQNQENRVDNDAVDEFGVLFNRETLDDFFDQEEKQKEYRILYNEPPHITPYKLWENLAYSVSSVSPVHYGTSGGFYTTYSVTQHILDHFPQFQFGLDFNHLPRGFRLIKQEVKDAESLQIILDYDPKYAGSSFSDDPLSISVYPVLTPTPLAHSLLHIYLEKGQETKGYKLIKEMYNTLNQLQYDKKAFNLLLQYLPLLSNVEPFSLFNQLFLIKDEQNHDRFSVEAFDYLFRYIEKITKIYPENKKDTVGGYYNPENPKAARGINKYFAGDSNSSSSRLSEKRAIAAVNCCHHYAKNLAASPEDLIEQLLYIFIEHDPILEQSAEQKQKLLAQLHYWHKKLSLTYLNLNSLTQVYQQYGYVGLEKIFTLWNEWKEISLPAKEKNLLALLHDICFKNCHSYFFLLEPSYNDTIKLIQSFYAESEDVGNFWETLLTQHYRMVIEDDLTKLANSFEAFRKQLPRLVGADANQLPKLKKPTTRQGENEVRSRGARDRRALTGEAGNASRRKVIVGDANMNPVRDECASHAGRSRPNDSRVMRTNFGDTTAEIFREHSDSLVKSLPVTLSRILSLLEHCRSGDRRAQWKCMAELDFSSQGVAKAMVANYLFVLPEMGRNSGNDVIEYVSINKNVRGRVSNSWNNVKDLVSATNRLGNVLELTEFDNRTCLLNSSHLEGLKRRFFEYIAAQSSALSIDFYRTAEQVIDKTNHPQLVVNLYRVLAASTTNHAVLCIKNPNELLNSWKNFINKFRFLSTDMLRKLELGSTFTFGENARKAERKIAELLEGSVSICFGLPLPVFLTVMGHVQTALGDKARTATSMDSLLTEVKKAIESIATAAEQYEEVYSGLYNPFESNQNSDLATLDEKVSFLSDYCIMLQQIMASEKIADRIKPKLIVIIASFQLTVDHINKIMDLIASINNKQKDTTKIFSSVFLLDALCTLLLINSVGNEKGSLENLTPKHLCTLLTELDKQSVLNSDAEIRNQVCSLIEQHLPSKYYNVDYLTQLKNSGNLELSTRIKEAIKVQFSSADQKQVIDFLESYLLSNPDISQLDVVFSTLLALYQSFKKKPEIQKALLANLNSVIKIVKKKEDAKKLYQLMHGLDKNEQTLDFIYFIRQYEQRNGNNTDNLLQRLSGYLDSMAQLRKQGLSLSMLERFSCLFKQLLLDPSKKTSLDQLVELQGKIKGLIAVDNNYVASLFSLLTALITQEEHNSAIVATIIKLLNDFTRSAALLKEKGITNASAILMALFHHGKTQPAVLAECLEEISNGLTQDASKTNLLRLLSIFLSRETKFSKENFCEVLDFFKDNEKSVNYLEVMNTCYATPPYMSLGKLLDCLNKSKIESLNPCIVLQEYKRFSQAPCSRDKHNGFDLGLALTQKNSFTGISLLDETCKQLSTYVEEVKVYSKEVLQETLNNLKQEAASSGSLNVNRLSLLIAALAELLYRSNSTADHAFELNTTQYLAILAVLSANGRAITEIATGEGKSRIMMLLVASQHILGKTTDFVTSDLALARRDYLEYAPFFLALGAKTQLLTADSSFEHYQCNAIHFTDATQLSHFRNKAIVHQKVAIDSDESKRSLLIDEVDATLFDKSETRFNYSAPDKGMQEMEWIYRFLVMYVLQHEELYVESFIEFVTAKLAAEKQPNTCFEQLNSIAKSSQLQTWLESAVVATSLKLNQDFIIKPDVSQSTRTGSVITKSLALVLHENRVYPDSRYAAGVHECLEALLEMRRRSEIPVVDGEENELCDLLKQCKTPFFPKTEIRTICSSNSYDLFQAYQQGNILGVTGTSGSEHEQGEVSRLYQKPNCSIQFIKVPRHKTLQRIDRPIRLAADSRRQVQLLMEYIQAARLKKQPVLLISKDLDKSKKLYQAIFAINKDQLENKRISEEYFQHIPCDLSPEQESEAINKAGQAGMITLGTSLLGRGIDIPLQGEVKNTGLLVLLDYLPSSQRDYQQIIGRSGRYGALGETRLIVTRDDVNFDFYLNSSTWQTKEWQKRTKEAQAKRILEFLLGNIYTKFQSRFSFKEDYYDKWSAFLKKCRTLQTEIKEKITGWFKRMQDKTKLYNKAQIEEETLRKLLDEYEKDMDTAYQAEQIPQNDVEATKEKERSEKITEILYNFNLKVEPSRKNNSSSPVYTDYDPALDGRAKVYKHIFTETRATILGKRGFFANTQAALRGEGILFADTRALLRGERRIFANTRS